MLLRRIKWELYLLKDNIYYKNIIFTNICLNIKIIIDKFNFRIKYLTRAFLYDGFLCIY